MDTHNVDIINTPNSCSVFHYWFSSPFSLFVSLFITLFDIISPLPLFSFFRYFRRFLHTLFAFHCLSLFSCCFSFAWYAIFFSDAFRHFHRVIYYAIFIIAIISLDIIIDILFILFIISLLHYYFSLLIDIRLLIFFIISRFSLFHLFLFYFLRHWLFLSFTPFSSFDAISFIIRHARCSLMITMRARCWCARCGALCRAIMRLFFFTRCLRVADDFACAVFRCHAAAAMPAARHESVVFFRDYYFTRRRAAIWCWCCFFDADDAYFSAAARYFYVAPCLLITRVIAAPDADAYAIFDATRHYDYADGDTPLCCHYFDYWYYFDISFTLIFLSRYAIISMPLFSLPFFFFAMPFSLSFIIFHTFSLLRSLLIHYFIDIFIICLMLLLIVFFDTPLLRLFRFSLRYWYADIFILRYVDAVYFRFAHFAMLPFFAMPLPLCCHAMPFAVYHFSFTLLYWYTIATNTIFISDITLLLYYTLLSLSLNIDITVISFH